MENSYIGHFVSVISKEDVRIEGTLSHLNLKESLIIMKNGERESIDLLFSHFLFLQETIKKTLIEAILVRVSSCSPMLW